MKTIRRLAVRSAMAATPLAMAAGLFATAAWTTTAWASPAVYTQKCPDGDLIHVNMTKKAFTLVRGGKSWHATWDDSFAFTWSPSNPPPPDGGKFATQGSVAADGVFFGDGTIDSNTVCPIVH